jgi:ABC-2 type transport system ATP-binding protein
VNRYRFILAASAVALSWSLAGCKVNEMAAGAAEQKATAPADFPGVKNTVPVSPAAGQSRAGMAYSVYIQTPGTGDKVAFTVFEPWILEGGKTYPLVLQASGFGLRRDTPSSNANVKPLVDAGYGVISFDHRGHGESSGAVRNMDPDFEGQNVLAILDWAEARLDWLQYAPSEGDPHNLVLGSIGGSYGGMYQYMLHNIDPKRRLDAMVPWVAPNDLTYSNFPGGVPKAAYLAIRSNPNGPAGDPFVADRLAASLQANKMVDDYADFLYYHSNQYFCSDRRVATNGGPGTAPEHPPLRGPKVNALIFQGMRDTLFNFTEGYANYVCLKAGGGDVRLLSYQSGHNAANLVPDPGVAYLPPGNAFDGRCGSLHLTTAIGAFFEQYLKGVPGAADAVPTQPCLSIAKDDAVLVGEIMTKQSGGATAVDVRATKVTAGTGLDKAVAIELGIAGAQGSSVVAGIPHLHLNVQRAPDATGEPILFVGLGQTRNDAPGVWDLINNQVMPVRGTGPIDVDLVGIAARLVAGEKLALLVYGRHSQFVAPPSTNNVADPAIVPVTVSGKVWVPLLPRGSYQAAP